MTTLQTIALVWLGSQLPLAVFVGKFIANSDRTRLATDPNGSASARPVVSLSSMTSPTSNEAQQDHA